jgi:hypothetical protein
VLVTIVTVAFGAAGHPDLAVIPLAVAVAGLAVVTTPAATLGASVCYWFLVAGFVVGREGQVSVTSASMAAAAVLVLTAVTCVVVLVAVRWVLAGHRAPAARGAVRILVSRASTPHDAVSAATHPSPQPQR